MCVGNFCGMADRGQGCCQRLTEAGAGGRGEGRSEGRFEICEFSGGGQRWGKGSTDAVERM